MKKVLAIVSCVAALSYGAWKQDRFVIGSYWDPPFFDDETADLKSLQQFKDAGFNTLSGIVPRYPVDPNQPMDQSRIQNRWRHALQLGKIKIFTTDYFEFSTSSFNGVNAAKRFSQNTLSTSPWNCPTCRSIFEGYHVWDEPTDASFVDGAVSDVGTPIEGSGSYALRNMQNLTAADPDVVSWVNLLSYSGSKTESEGIWHRNFFDYGKYISGFFAGGANVISFDFYPLYADKSQKTWMLNNYYLNHQIIADSCKKYGISFWGFPLSQVHGDYVIPSRGATALTAFVPVLYGAKGLFWFTYAQTGIVPGIVNADGAPNLLPNAPLYIWVKGINAYLNRLGPTILNWSWMQTVHGSSTNNQFDGNSGVYEKNLPTIGQSTPVLKGGLGDQGSFFVVGIFSGKAAGESFLAILNKDLESTRTITISLKDSSRAYLTTASMDSWKALGKGQTFTLKDLQPGEMQIVRLTTQSVSGNINPLR